MKRNPKLIKLGYNIKRLRKLKGFSQEGFATTAGLSRAYYGGVERGERNVGVLNLFLIADALGIHVRELFS